jgi:hypothetical protein
MCAVGREGYATSVPAGEASPQYQELPLVWVGLEDFQIVYASTFAAQVVSPDEIVLIVGQATPPLVTGTPAEQAAQMTKVSFVQARPIARFNMSSRILRQLISILQQTLENNERIAAAAAQMERGQP